ncbi:MAG: hypothetical protein JSW11_02960 [Candidatus Heimdallarchaeota archaeon]|nr:MAG: hypothetical protein JSW11_02960 [Candidatus Heimdallarchaeota archaeon]
MASVKKIIIVIAITITMLIGGFVGINFLRMINDKDPPRIISVGYNPHPKVNTSSTIQIFVEDVSGIEFCKIYYRLNESEWVSRALRRYVILCCPPRFLIRLGPFISVGTQFDLYFVISDKKNNILVSDTYSFTVVDS